MVIRILVLTCKGIKCMDISLSHRTREYLGQPMNFGADPHQSMANFLNQKDNIAASRKEDLLIRIRNLGQWLH